MYTEYYLLGFRIIKTVYMGKRRSEIRQFFQNPLAFLSLIRHFHSFTHYFNKKNMGI